MVTIINKALRGEDDLKQSLIVLLTSSLLLFSGCSGGSSASDGVAETTELYIKSAVYDNNATTRTADDTLYIYFNKTIDTSSIATDTSSNYVVTGSGAIGSASGSDYNDTLFHRHLISQEDGTTGSMAITTANDTNISLATSTITDTNGYYPNDYNKTIVEKFRVMLQTGDTNNTTPNSDGDLKRGAVRSYTNNENGTVTDNATGLIWQQEDDNNTYAYSSDGTATEASDYCTNLNLGGSTAWRLPTIDELVQLTDKGSSNPAINPIFTNVNNSYYWSSTTYLANPNYAWYVFFNYGYDFAHNKTNTGYVRCVR